MVNNMPKFYSAYNYPVGAFEPKCPKEIGEYILDPNGEVIQTGTINFYERIQSHADSCSITRKLEQYSMGNSFALGVPGGEYGDFSNLPTNMAEVLNSKQEAQRAFSELPESIRNIFGDDYSAFAKSLQDGSYAGKIERYATEQLSKLGAGTSGQPSSTTQTGGIE